MRDDSLSCPYCNTVLSPLRATDGQLTCPRCGELLPAHLAEAIQARASTEPSPAATADRTMPGRPPRSSLRRVAGIVVGIMGIMAILSFTYAWNTVAWRRARDPKPPRPTQPAAIRLPAPIELAALGYLPADTAIIAGAYVVSAEKTPRGQEFLQGQRVGSVPLTPADLENWTGLKVSDIDHAVLGIKVEQRLIPALVLVVQARQPIDQEKVRTALKAERTSEVGKKKAWHFNSKVGGKVSLEALLWFAGPQTVVVTLSRVEMEKLPEKPTADAKQLPDALRDALKQWVHPGAQAWLAGHVETWDSVAPLLALVIDKENALTLTSLRTFAFGVRLDNGIAVAGAARGPDDAATQRLEQRWTKMEIPENPKQWEPLFRALAKSYTYEIKNGWFIFSAEADGEGLAKATQP